MKFSDKQVRQPSAPSTNLNSDCFFQDLLRVYLGVSKLSGDNNVRSVAAANKLLIQSKIQFDPNGLLNEAEDPQYPQKLKDIHGVLRRDNDVASRDLLVRPFQAECATVH